MTRKVCIANDEIFALCAKERQQKWLYNGLICLSIFDLWFSLSFFFNMFLFSSLLLCSFHKSNILYLFWANFAWYCNVMIETWEQIKRRKKKLIRTLLRPLLSPMDFLRWGLSKNLIFWRKNMNERHFLSKGKLFEKKIVSNEKVHE